MQRQAVTSFSDGTDVWIIASTVVRILGCVQREKNSLVTMAAIFYLPSPPEVIAEVAGLFRSTPESANAWTQEAG